MFDSGIQKAVYGLKSARAMVSNPGARQTGGRRFGGFGTKLPPTPGKRKASATTSEGAKMDGLVGRQCLWALRFDGLGLKTITHLLWAGRSLDKIDDINISSGT